MSFLLPRLLAPRPVYILSLLLLNILLLADLAGSVLLSRGWSNLGWISLARYIYTNDATSAALSVDAVNDFEKAIALDRANQSGYRGAGIQTALLLDEQRAQSYWQQGNIHPDILIQLGELANKRGQTDLALLYYRSAARMSVSDAGQGKLLAGRVCQKERVSEEVLSDENEAYCRAYFADNGGNLLLDGQIDYPIDWGWIGSFSFYGYETRAVNIDWKLGVPAPSLRTVGLTDTRHGGLYQRIALTPGTTVRFSGYFRLASNKTPNAWLLYIGWRSDDQSQGNYVSTVDLTTDWTYLERDFTLPENAEPWAQFWPVFLTGQEEIWFDDVSVKILLAQPGSD